MKKLLTILLTVLFATVVEASPSWKLHHYNNDDGLSNNSVTCIHQDRKGFMWFGTKNGLNRFDGQEFKRYVYTGKPEDLCSSIIYDISEDTEGRMWVATADGISIYYPESDFFCNFNNFGFTDIEIRGLVWQVAIGTDGCIWILTQHNLYTLADGVCTDITERIKEFMGCLPEKIDIDKTTAFMGGWNGKVVCYERKSDRFFPVVSLPSPIWALGLFGSDKLMAGTYREGLYVTDIKEQTLEHFTLDASLLKNNLSLPFPDKTDRGYIERAGMDDIATSDGLFIRCMEQIGNNEVWVGSESGLLILRDGAMMPFPKKEIAMGREMEPDIPRAIFRDRDGNVWVGNYFNGIDCFSPNHSIFESYTLSDDDSNKGKRVRCFAEDSVGGLWIGTEDNGLYRYDLATEVLSSATDAVEIPLAGFNVQALSMASADELLIASTTEGGNMLNVQTGKLTHLVNNIDAYSVYKDRTGKLWAGIRFGLYVYDNSTHSFVEYDPSIENLSNSILEDMHGNIWVTALNLIFRINQETGEVKPFEYSTNDPTSLCYGRATCSAMDQKGRLWFGFEEGGMCLYDETANCFSRFTMKDGLPSNAVYAIVPDDERSLWLGTAEGLVLFDPDEHRVVAYYDVDDGMPTKSINYRAGLRLHTGKLVFGTNEGFFMFDPSTPASQSDSTQVTLTGLYLYDKEVSPFR